MKNKYIVSIYVAECNEFRDEGKVYEGFYDVSEALEAFKSLPNGRTPVIGLRIHKKGEKELTDAQIDILIGDKIHLESLEYIPRVADCDDAVNYIAELITWLPDVQIKGIIPEYLKNRIKAYEMLHENESNAIKQQLLRKLSQLTAEALKFLESDEKSEKDYGAALLQYASRQKAAVNNGQENIDLSTFPIKESFCKPDPEENAELYSKEKVKITESERPLHNSYKDNSLLAKLYEYQMLIKQRS